MQSQSQVSREAARLNLRWEDKVAVPWKQEQSLISLFSPYFCDYPLLRLESNQIYLFISNMFEVLHA